MPAPVALRSDNFTPPSRTPWGGTRVLSRYKQNVHSAHAIVGESWEVSVEPAYPSLTLSGDSLAERIAAAPLRWLGAAGVARFGPQTPLLVKLLDAADNLSVQVHPANGDPALSPLESGKPEAWVVLDAMPGAGLYLGFQHGVTRDDVAACLAEGARIDALMNFVRVRPGDAYVIDAGTAHAIGAGVTLLEPQLVWPGRSGVTYRFWDWERRYDSAGKLEPTGTPRVLHVERSLAVTRWDIAGGHSFVEACRARPRVLESGFTQRASVVDWAWFQVERWSGTGALAIPAVDSMWAITVVGGCCRIVCDTGEVAIGCGESAVVPAAGGRLSVTLEDADVFAVRT